MSVQTKKRFKNLGKIIGGALFALLMFTNIKIAMLDDSEMARGDISLLGIEVNLFDATYGESILYVNRGPGEYQNCYNPIFGTAGIQYVCLKQNYNNCSPTSCN